MWMHETLLAARKMAVPMQQMQVSYNTKKWDSDAQFKSFVPKMVYDYVYDDINKKRLFCM